MWRRTSLCSCLLLSAAPLAGQSGPPFKVADTSYNVYGPDVAYDATNDLYLVVWRDGDEVRVRRVRADGTTVGAILRLGPCTQLPRVANVAAQDAFVVIWNNDRTLEARAVDAAIGAVGSTLTVASSAFSEPFHSDYDLGGEATESHDDVVVVWSDHSSLRAVEIGFSSRLVLGVVTAPTTIASSTNQLRYPRISNSGGPTGRYLVAWVEFPSGGNHVLAAVLDRDTRVLDGTVTLELRSPLFPFVSTVDGDGSDWVVAFSQLEKNGSAHDVLCRSVSFDPANPGATAVGPARIVEADPGDDERSPAVGWIGGSALIAYDDDTAGGSDLHAKSVDLFTCALCEPQFAVDDPNSDTFHGVEVASERSGGGAGEGALIVWSRRTTTGSGGSIRARAFIAEDGLVTDLGGGCGGGGQALATCARAGHGEFRLRLLGGLRSTGRQPVPCYLIASSERIDAQCGPCRLVPDPSVGFVVSTSSMTGDADIAVPLPASTALQGVTFYTQWFQPRLAAPCTSLGGHFSNAIKVQIQ